MTVRCRPLGDSDDGSTRPLLTNRYLSKRRGVQHDSQPSCLLLYSTDHSLPEAHSKTRQDDSVAVLTALEARTHLHSAMAGLLNACFNWRRKATRETAKIAVSTGSRYHSLALAVAGGAHASSASLRISSTTGQNWFRLGHTGPWAVPTARVSPGPPIQVALGGHPWRCQSIRADHTGAFAQKTLVRSGHL